jgi:N-formylmaleamate deformylase
VRLRGEWLASCDETAVVDSYAWFHLEAFEPVWQEVEPPALLLYGDRSPVVTEPDATLLRQVNPRADVVAVADAGHMVPWDNLDQTVTEIEKFASRLGASS